MIIEISSFDAESNAYEFAFDAFEAVYLLAVEWGEYAVITYLKNQEFKPSPLLNYERLSENGKELYEILNAELEKKYYG